MFLYLANSILISHFLQSNFLSNKDHKLINPILSRKAMQSFISIKKIILNDGQKRCIGL